MNMCNEKIIISIQNGKDNEGCLMLELYNQNLGFLYKICNRLGVPEDLREDISQEYYLWLSNAVNNFDTDKDILFSSYFYEYLKGEIIRFLENQKSCRIPSYKCSELYIFKKEKNRLSQILLREPTDKELASFMGVKISKITELKKDLERAKSKSLNDVISEDGKELQDLIPEKTDSIEALCDSIDIEYRNKELWRIVTNESNFDKKSITDYYKGLYEGDKRLIRNDLYRTIRVLKNQPGKLKKLKELCDYNCFRQKGIRAFQRDGFSVVEDLAILLYESEENKMNKAEFKTVGLNKENRIQNASKEGQDKIIGKCAICGGPAEKRMYSHSSAINFVTKGVKPSKRSIQKVCIACLQRELHTNKFAFEVNEDGEMIEYR